MKHQAQRFEQYTLNKSNNVEKASFLKTIKVVPLIDVPHDANVLNSQTIYKVKTNNDESHTLKS